MRRTAARLAAAVVLVAAGGLVLAACRADRSPVPAKRLPPDEAARVLIDRNWIDRWPTSETEQLHVFRFTPAMGGGVYQDRTLYAGSFELFMFSIDGDHLDVELPHQRERVRSTFSIQRVDGPAPFDLMLTLSPSPRGPKVYYGRSVERAADWAWLDGHGFFPRD